MYCRERAHMWRRKNKENVLTEGKTESTNWCLSFFLSYIWWSPQDLLFVCLYMNFTIIGSPQYLIFCVFHLFSSLNKIRPTTVRSMSEMLRRSKKWKKSCSNDQCLFENYNFNAEIIYGFQFQFQYFGGGNFFSIDLGLFVWKEIYIIQKRIGETFSLEWSRRRYVEKVAYTLLVLWRKSEEKLR
jgi:hypothetical protein